MVEYTLRGVHKPVGVTTYEHLTALRPGLPDALPTPEELRSEFAEAERAAGAADELAQDAGPRRPRHRRSLGDTT